MRDVQLDVMVELPYSEAERLGPQQLTTEVIELLRIKADQECQFARGYLHTDRPPELVVKRAQHKLLGSDYLLVASRWWASMPENWSPHR